MPTVTLVATPFVPLARYEAEGLGAPDLRLVVVEYPMTGVAIDEAVRRAESAFADVISGLARANAEVDRA